MSEFLQEKKWFFFMTENTFSQNSKPILIIKWKTLQSKEFEIWFVPFDSFLVRKGF